MSNTRRSSHAGSSVVSQEAATPPATLKDRVARLEKEYPTIRVTVEEGNKAVALAVAEASSRAANRISAQEERLKKLEERLKALEKELG